MYVCDVMYAMYAWMYAIHACMHACMYAMHVCAYVCNVCMHLCVCVSCVAARDVMQCDLMYVMYACM